MCIILDLQDHLMNMARLEPKEPKDLLDHLDRLLLLDRLYQLSHVDLLALLDQLARTRL